MPQVITVATVVLAVSAACAKVRFNESTVQGPGDSILSCDLDGDGLKDIVVADEPNLAIYYQDAQRGFAESPDQVCPLGDNPSVFWPARLAEGAQSLLVMTSDGVTELDFTTRRGPATRKRIITQKTVLPDSSKGASVAYFPLSPRIEGGAPVILLPVGGDLQVWRLEETWQRVQTLVGALETSIWASRDGLGYDQRAELTLSFGDITADHRDDILLRTSLVPICRYTMYAQREDGLFTTAPILTWSGKWDWSWYCWTDINRDGRVDLMNSKWLQEPWFIPGMLSGRVLVRIFMAGEQGQIPAEPQQIFRKNDWIDSIPVVDIDGDGCMDLALGYSTFDSREGFRKALTAKQIDFKLRFHFCRPGGSFAEKPDCDASLLIRLDHPSTELSYSRSWYLDRFVSLLGDFDGDGDKDLLVRDRADRISAYPFISRQVGFARSAGAEFGYTDPFDRMRIEDLNNDRVSDLILSSRNKDLVRIFISRTR